ncbi:MAG: aspartate-semialdehyde dehydrogenase [Gammaproteobacteria bacterium]|nr:aspartate-semialdehyde dehydrogenase [Gammaproteobacteria bacterium]
MTESFDVAVAGATGLVGEHMLAILESRDFPVGQLHALASSRSAGNSVMFRGKPVVVQDLADFDFSQVQIGLFSAGGSVSAEHAPRAGAAGCVVVDNTSYFRNEPDIPLVVPEVNGEAIAAYPGRNIIANPNCSTIQMVLVLKPIHDAVGISRINVATYQSVSGAGRAAVETLADQTARLLNGRPLELEKAAKQIAFNALPHIDSFQDNGYTREEMKMVWETRKILDDDSIQVNPTCVRIPVFYGHSEAVHIETREAISAAGVRELLQAMPGVAVLDERELGGYPTAVTEGAGRDEVYVGRIREDISHDRGISLWIVADNIRKGAALNSVQIAEILARDYL